MNRSDVKDGVTIRQPSVANLMIDSADRNVSVYPSASNFSIQKTFSVLNGIFSRVATTEVVMEYNYPNVGAAGFASRIQYNTTAGQYLLDFPEGFYTVEETINALVALLNTVTTAGQPSEGEPASNITWAVAANPVGGAILTQSGTGAGVISIAQDPASSLNLIEKLFGTNSVGSSGTTDPLITITSAVDLRPYRYLDIVSEVLTYAQDVKDASTASYVRNVLCRWYFDYDEQNMIDGYGYPILMGYKPFYLRRIYNPPKQINWDSNLPISGVIDFTLYQPDGSIAQIGKSEFLLTLQVSEN
jgi:hypothetical protein